MPEKTMEWLMPRAAVFLCWFAVVTATLGCDQAPSVRLTTDDTAAPPMEQKQAAPRAQLVEESWFAYYIGEAKIGHGYNRVVSVKRDSQELMRIDIDQQISLLRNMDPVDQTIHLRSLERPDGEVVELHSQISDGNSSVETRAVPEEGRLIISLSTAGNTLTQSITWKPEWRGFFAEHQVLREQPLKPGQVLTYWGFIPVLNVAGETRLTIKDWEDVETPFGRERLLRVDSLLTAGPVKLDSVIWCDKKGEIRKQHLPQSNITAHRTVKKLALAANDAVDLYETLNVKVSNPMPRPHHSRRAIYHARLRSGADPLRIFPSDHSQRVTPLDKHEAQIEVIAIRPESPSLEETPQSPPDPADLAPNALIQSDDRRVRQLLDEIPSRSEDPLQWALDCEAFVSRTIENKALTEAFDTAAEVAESRTGDCTEHAVLTAALCRAHGIPTRVATGLVAYEDIYAFHMWNEVWVGDRWIPIDSTLGRGGIGAGHIKLGVSNLEGVSPFAALAPVLEVMGALELKVASFEE